MGKAFFIIKKTALLMTANGKMRDSMVMGNFSTKNLKS